MDIFFLTSILLSLLYLVLSPTAYVSTPCLKTWILMLYFTKYLFTLACLVLFLVYPTVYSWNILPKIFEIMLDLNFCFSLFDHRIVIFLLFHPSYLFWSWHPSHYFLKINSTFVHLQVSFFWKRNICLVKSVSFLWSVCIEFKAEKIYVINKLLFYCIYLHLYFPFGEELVEICAYYSFNGCLSLLNMNIVKRLL